MDLGKFFCGRIEKRHAVDRRVLCHREAGRELEASAISDNYYPPEHCERLEVAFKIHVRKHLDNDVDAFAAGEFTDLTEMVLISVIEDGVGTLLFGKLLTFVRA